MRVAHTWRVRAEQITDAVAEHGEGPVWWPGWGGLRWVDMLAGDVLALGGDGQVTRTHHGSVAAALRPRAGGGAVIALERSFALVDPRGVVRQLPEVWADPTVRFNDGGCDPQGRFLCGSMGYDQRSGGATLHRLDPGGEVRTVLAGVTVSNGLDWSPDGALAYYVDSAEQRVDVFDHDPESGLTGRRALVEIPRSAGTPDGLCVDADGCVWVAMWCGSAVHRYRPDGVLDGVVELPVTQVTACTFGGDGLDELLITTSRQGLPAGAQAGQAGAVFRCRPGVVGRLPRTFAG